MAGCENSEAWLKEVVSRVVCNIGAQLEEMQYELTKSVFLIMSSIHYVCVRYKKNVKARHSELSIIVKRPLDRSDMTASINSQFHNEIVFYSTYAQLDENFPRCFYYSDRLADGTSGFLIALENVEKRGYHPCSFTFDAPLDYTLLVMREIALFHAKGYIFKEKQPEKFFDFVKQLEETKYDEKKGNFLKNFVNTTSTRAVEYLRSHGHDAVFCDKLEAVLLNAFENVMMKTVIPVEPLSTICHGDLTLNNVLFNKEGDKKQHRAMLIDFALLRYSTPVIDLSTYLGLSCSNEVMRDDFYKIMHVYHETLTNCLLQAGVSIKNYSFNAFVDDYKKGSLFGFVIASFYLPLLMGYFKKTTGDPKILGEMNKRSGGDKLSKILADKLLILHELNCLDYILQCCEEH